MKNFIFIWPLNKIKISQINYDIYQYNQIEKLKEFQKHYSSEYNFLYFNELDFDSAKPKLDTDRDIVFAHAPVGQYAHMSDAWRHNYYNTLSRCENLYLMHPGNPYRYKPTGPDLDVLAKAKALFCWSGNHFYNLLMQEFDGSGISRCLSKEKVFLVTPAINLKKIEFKPNFKPGNLNFFHSSNLSHIKAPHNLILTCSIHQASLYVSSEIFANNKLNSFDISYKGNSGENISVKISESSIEKFAGKYQEIGCDINIDEKQYLSRLKSLGYVVNECKNLKQYIFDNFNYYIHLSFSEGVSAAILENAARGILPCVNAESGFDAPSIVSLTHNFTANQKVILGLHDISESEYLSKVKTNYEYLQTNHSWEVFFNKIDNVIDAN
jgi:hypothetical protein